MDYYNTNLWAVFRSNQQRNDSVTVIRTNDGTMARNSQITQAYREIFSLGVNDDSENVIIPETFLISHNILCFWKTMMS